MSFDKFIYPYNHHHEQENEHFYYPKKFSGVPSQSFCINECEIEAGLQ